MSLSTPTIEPAVDVLHGVTVVDPFRWLEQRDTEPTEKWIASQQERHHAYFSNLPSVDVLRTHLSGYVDIDTLDQPVRDGKHFFFRLRKKGEEQGSIHVIDLGTEEDRMLVDPSPQGSFAAVSIHRVSASASLLAYELRRGGADARSIHFVSLANGIEFVDHLPDGYPYGLVFAPNGSGFYYCHELASPTKDREHAICFHAFGANDDLVLFRTPRTAHSRLTLIGDHIFIGAIVVREEDSELRTDFYVADLRQVPEWKPVFRGKPHPYVPILANGRIFIWTENGAPNGNILELNQDGSPIRVTVPEWDFPIQQVCVAGKMLYLRYLAERKNTIRCWTLDGEWTGKITLPTGGTINILPSLAPCPLSLFYSHESFAEPPSLHEYCPIPLKMKAPLRRYGCPQAMGYRVDEVWYPSHDGTKIPMSLVMRQNVDPLGESPAILTSYGGFGVAMTPRYSVLVRILLSLGAVFAVPSIRGGSEFGKAWHAAAKGRSRPLAFSDFIAGAEWLAQHSSTSARPLGIFGGSNSGLLVAVAMTRRPDLFRAVLCIAPLLDMVRYEAFDRAKRWSHEFGTVGDAGDFKVLFDYSPYHNISDDMNYPASLFVTGDQDDRCNPAHVRKMVARLQSRPLQTKPVLVDYSAKRGHSPVLPLTVRTEALAERIAFFCEELGIPISLGSDMQ